jgi:hypothetical protein
MDSKKAPLTCHFERSEKSNLLRAAGERFLAALEMTDSYSMPLWEVELKNPPGPLCQHSALHQQGRHTLRHSSIPAPSPLSVIPAVFKPESSQIIIGYKSLQLGLVLSINCTFHFRFQPFNRFSLWMAESMLACSSYQTS